MHDSGKIDLHTHTTYSDGSYTPAQLIYKLRNAGVRTFSITDHDTVDAVPGAYQLCKFYEMEIIPGVEFTTYVDDREVHILGYFFAMDNAALQEVLKTCAHARISRAEKIVEQLNAQNVGICIEDVLAEAGTAPVTRPHIASAMVKKGFVRSFYDAFSLYLSNDGTCYQKKYALDPETVVELMRESGGISVLAHPSNLGDDIIGKVILAGIDGLEVFHPSHSNPQTKHFAEIAKAKSLFITGGSDFHGGKRNDEGNIGKFLTPQKSFEVMAALKQRAKAV